MNVKSSDRVWLIGGAVAAAVLVAATWFIFVSPQRAQAAELRAQTAVAQDSVATLRRHLAQLRRENANLGAYKAQLAREQAALPTEPGLSGFLRQVQSAGDAAAVSVGSVTVGLPAAVAGNGKAYAMQIAVTADGTPTQLGSFLDQLQLVQPRAVLITNVSTAVGVSPATLTLTLTIQVFAALQGGK
ncbi:MAG: hypothetical protein V7603_3937 [Micromonosporaceae bacterium]